MKNLNYKFKDSALLEFALTQSGVNAAHNNERLEFVGDRVLGLTVAAMLYEMFPTETEGELARRHAFLVSTETLADVATELGLAQRIHHGHMTGGRIKHILADATEAVLGAIYFDGGFDAARTVILDIWHDMAARQHHAPKDPKTMLQEVVQKQAGALPVYTYNPGVGASHEPVFEVSVTALDKTATATGASKKAASIAAAAALLKLLAISDDNV